ncbi:P-loop NTPase family protein [Saccharothrix syringae]|uniref:ATP-binding protein n=1 Tax=Saccharothrix syringae TaxID=103733 RepID=A0A5Q0H114_SACSY|nr:ATP-binding protein [Saccharothrix syringae]QFZ19878.1 ATP-binding protein [Saccharothrix syringae]
MNAVLRERPPWLARVDVDGAPVGAGVLLAPDLVLTCDHVVPVDRVRVVLVHAGHESAAAVEFRAPVTGDGRGDLAVLRLDAPADATAAPLRAPRALADHGYLVQGFAGGHHAEARGRLGGRVGPGWVQMDDARGFGHVLDRGFSGAPVWDDEVGAVVGLVVAAHRPARGGYLLPVDEVVRWWPAAAAFTGWRLDLDDAFATHWLPRARGVEPHEPTGTSRFVGRRRVLEELAGHLAAEPDGRVRVVTGAPGSGKSAVLARTAVLACRATRHLVPPGELTAAPPPVGGLTVAVHARGRTAADVVRAIAAATDVDAGDPAHLLQALTGPVAVLLDALDEAAAGAAEEIATLLARLAALPGNRAVVGTRLGARGAAPGPLLRRLGDPVVLDLDAPRYLDHHDLVRYARDRVGDPALAEEIARHAGGNFLIAQLACLSGTDRLPSTVGAALDDYLRARFEHPRRVRDLLLPLAFVAGTGLPEGPLWLALANALTAGAYTAGDLREVLGSAASYLVEQADRRYRLFHQALDDTLRAEHTGPEPERVVHRVLRAVGPGDEYVRRHLPGHAVEAGELDEVLADLDLVLALDPAGLVPHLAHAASEPARVVAHVYRRAAHGMTAPDRRAAYFCLVARQSGFGEPADRCTDPSWRADVLAWDVEQGQQVVGRMPGGTRLVLWVDHHGRAAAFAAHDGRLALYRAQPDALAAVDGLRSPETGLGFEAAAAHVHPDGREVGLTVDHRGTVRAWSFTDGLRARGTVHLGGTGVTWDVVLADTPDGLLALVVNDHALWLLDVGGEAPVVLDHLDGRGLASGAVTAHEGSVWAVSIGDDGVRLFRVVERCLTRVGAPLRVHRYSPLLARFLVAGDGRLLVVSASTEQRVVSAVTPSGPVVLEATRAATSAAATLDGAGVVVFGDPSGGLAAYEVTGEVVPLMAVAAHHGGVAAVAVGSVSTAFTFGSDALVKRWDLRYAPPLPDRPPPPFGRMRGRVALVPAPGRGALTTRVAGTGFEVWWAADGLVRLDTPPGPRGDDMAHDAVAARGPGGTVLVAVLHGSGRIATWTLADGRWTSAGTTALPGELPYFGTVAAVGAAGEPVVAVGQVDGTVRYRERSEGRWRPLPEHRFGHRITRLEFCRVAGRLLLLVVAGGQAHLVSPWRAEPLGVLPTGAREQWVVLGHGGADVVAAVFDHHGGGPVVRLHSLTDKGFEPLTSSWAVPGGFAAAVTRGSGPEVWLALAADDDALHVWSCAPGATPREIAVTWPGARVRDLVWTDDHRLVVWCEAGVLSFDFRRA